MAIPPFGAPPAPLATASKPGKIQLAGDITGSATVPVLVNVVSPATVGDVTHIPVITYDAKGRITSTTTAIVVPGATRAFAFFA